MASKGSSVRFIKLVEESGKPERAVLWVPPEKNARFMNAVKENRVVSVHENVGTRKDYGIVGFKKDHGYLVFPKHLKAKAGAKVVGLKYDLLENEAPKDPIPPVSKKQSKTRAAAVRKRQEPAKSKFRVVVSGSIDFMEELEAANAKHAKQTAIERVKTGKGDVRTVDLKLKAKSARKI